MLTQVAEGVLVHQSELLRNNTVVVQSSAGVLLIDPGLTDDEMVCLADDLRGLVLPVVAGFSTHLIGIMCSGTPSSVRPPATAQPAARQT